jgi:hypothetical protein
MNLKYIFVKMFKNIERNRNYMVVILSQTNIFSLKQYLCPNILILISKQLCPNNLLSLSIFCCITCTTNMVLEMGNKKIPHNNYAIFRKGSK